MHKGGESPSYTHAHIGSLCVSVRVWLCVRLSAGNCMSALLMHWPWSNVVQNYLCVAHLTCTWQNIFCIYRMHFHHYPTETERDRERVRGRGESIKFWPGSWPDAGTQDTGLWHCFWPDQNRGEQSRAEQASPRLFGLKCMGSWSGHLSSLR